VRSQSSLIEGFPNDWITSSFEQEIARINYRCFFHNDPNGIIVNCTWGEAPNECFDTKYQQVEWLVSCKKISKILFFNFVDELDERWAQVIKNCCAKLGENNVKLIGYSPWQNDLNFQFWPLAVNRYFTKYSEKELEIKKIKHYYLCYNRKPHEHRVNLYRRLKKHNLLKKGIFTLGNDNHKDSITFEKNQYGGMNNAFKVESYESYAIPNDLMSLGNLKIWNTTFLNIVTETNYQTDGYPFLTEKTFKPIIGMRPFLILGPNGTVDWLHDNGFKTFNSDFKLPNRDLCIDDIIKGITNTSIDNVNDAVVRKIKHNRRRFFEFCSEEEKRIGIG